MENFVRINLILSRLQVKFLKIVELIYIVSVSYLKNKFKDK